MKKRHLYSLLFGIPGIVVAFLAYKLVEITMKVLFYFFVVGDSSWPVWTSKMITIITGIVFIATIFGATSLGFYLGKKREMKK